MLIPLVLAFSILISSPNAQVVIKTAGTTLNATTVNGPMLFADGTTSLPIIARLADPSTGFSFANQTINGSIGGTNYFAWTASGQNMGANYTIGWASDTILCRGGAANVIGIGGCTSSFPALKRNATAIDVRFGDDSGYAEVNASGFNIAGAFKVGGRILASASAPTAPSSCGSSPAVTTNNGTASWVITSGTGGVATGCTVTLPTATTGWNCNVTNITQTAAHRADRITVQTASTTTSATWEYQTVSTGAATAFTASDVFRGICFAY